MLIGMDTLVVLEYLTFSRSYVRLYANSPRSPPLRSICIFCKQAGALSLYINDPRFYCPQIARVSTMGVPKFFRWVTNRYPSILTSPITGPPAEPNVDNLYLDMNGVIHQCSHTDADVSEDLPFDVVCKNIFDEVCRIVDLVRPQQLIYIAVDGVAPRAKLNQQRARRFRSSHDRLQALRKSGASVTNAFDSNCITPGTEFMARLTKALQGFIGHMLRTNPIWHGLKVHFSGSEVPGEGEHKIVSFIRQERLKEHYLPNQRHCILGADADMIMLALATHEPYFLVLRDVLDFRRPKKPNMENFNTQTTHSNHNNAPVVHSPKVRNMNYIRINVLREYLVNELLESLNPAEFDGERIIDDFVFLTFLVGNDFLPHLPAINIGDDAFDLIFDAYKTVLASDSGYLVHEGVLDVVRLELILTLIGVTEKSLYYDQVLMAEQKERQARDRKEKLEKHRSEKAALLFAAETSSVPSSVGEGSMDGTSDVISDNTSDDMGNTVETSETSGATPVTVTNTTTPIDTTTAYNTQNNTHNVSLLDREEECKHNYYVTKFGIDIYTTAGQAALREIISAYLMGLQWCLQYYSIGCTSWEWFYPYHYGPFLQDMTQLSSVPAYADTVKLGNPLQPFQQLLACLPAASSGLLPAPYHALMNDVAFPLHDFYPTDFKTDLNGKKQDYEAVVILPFIDIDLLKQTEASMLAAHGNSITAEERERNTFGAESICAMYTLHNRRILPSRRMVTTSIAGVNGVTNTDTITTTSATSATTATTGLYEDTLGVKTIPFTLAPVTLMRPFAAALISGTVDPVTSIPGFPSRTELLEVVNYTKGYGKSKNSRKNIRSRANCYAEEGVEAFPMPGVVGNGNSGSGYENSSGSSRNESNYKNPSVATEGTYMDSTEAETIHVGGVLRLVVDTRTSQILQAIGQQVQTQSPYFHPITSSTAANSTSKDTNANDATDTTTTSATTSTFESHIDLPLYALVGDQLPHYESLLINSNILSKASTIFSTVKCALQPVALLSRSGLVSVKFVDVSHLNQLEDFLLQRLLGNEMLDGLNKKSTKQPSTADTHSGNSGSNCGSGGNGSNGVTKNRQGAGGVGFSRSIVIGSYVGEDSERFMDWLNKELYKLSALLTNLSCGELEYVGCEEEKQNEVVKMSVHLRV